jgi:type IV fimbrial biogenesis protein FimT
MRTRQRGFTVLELLIAVTVAGIILALALPNYTDVINKRAVTNTAEQVRTFVNLGRSQAVKLNEKVTVTMTSNGGFCVGMRNSVATEAAVACNCSDATAANYCQITEGGTTEAYVVDGASFENIGAPTLYDAGGGTVTSLSFTFDPVRGIVDADNDRAGAFVVESDNEKFALQVGVGLTGRVVVCVPVAARRSGTPQLPLSGYNNC